MPFENSKSTRYQIIYKKFAAANIHFHFCIWGWFSELEVPLHAGWVEELMEKFSRTSGSPAVVTFACPTANTSGRAFRRPVLPVLTKSSTTTSHSAILKRREIMIYTFTSKISLAILLTFYHTVIMMLLRRIWYWISSWIPSLISSFILITCLLDIVLMLWGEILFWSLIRVEGLRGSCQPRLCPVTLPCQKLLFFLFFRRIYLWRLN